MIAVLLLLQVATAGASPGPQLTATRYEFKTASESQSGDPVPMRATGRATATRSGSMLRYELTPTPIQLKLDGAEDVQTFPVVNPYTLILGEKRIYSIDTVKQEYFQADLGAVQNRVNDAMAGFETVDFKVSDTKFDVTDMGSAEKVAGRPTTRWRAAGTITLGMSAQGQTVAMTMEEITDYYYARDFTMPVIQALVPDTSAVTGPFAAILGREYAGKVVTGYSKLPKSTPIKTVTRLTMTAGMMEIFTVETIELASIETISVPASYFEIPKGFRKIDMPLPEMPKPPTAKE